MSRALATLTALLILLATALPVAAKDGAAQPPADAAEAADPEPPRAPQAAEVIPGEVVVKWRDAAKGPDVARARGLSVVAELDVPGKGMPAVLSTEGRGVDAVIAELSTDPAVEYAEPNYRIGLADEGSITAVSVNDPMTGGQYSLDQMRVRDAWSLSTGGSNIVAVLDTGVQYNHPDLAGRVLPGYDFVNDDTNASDDNGHGTWVSGIIAANANDGYGIAGVSWSDKILPVKIMSGSGTGSTSDLSSGIIWAADHGASVINMSVGGFPYAQYVQDAINYAWNKGVVLVGAAGNNGVSETFYPASFNNVVSVSATQVDGEFANWSSYGPKVDLSAPGASVLTTNCYACTYADHDSWGSHTYISGTSFATPNVAGVVALIRARYPTWTPSQVVSRLTSTVDDLGYAGWDDRYGLGRVNAYRALGASVSGGSKVGGGDAKESNNTLSTAKPIALNDATHPTIYPAGDVDVFSVDVPRAGRLDVTAKGVVDTRAYPYNRSGLPIDVIVELYSTGGTLLDRADAQWESGTELASVNVSGPTRILIRISNWYANGNARAYTVTPTYVDTVAPSLTARAPAPNATKVRYDGAVVTADFSEPVSGVSTSTMQLRTLGGTVISSSVSYSSSARRATLRPNTPLSGEVSYVVVLTGGIKDAGGNSLPSTSWRFTTGKAVPRVAGEDRYGTAVAISRSEFGAGVPVAYVATGSSYPDALSGGPAARVGGGPLLLTERGSLTPETAAELARLKPGRIVVLGGTGVVSSGVVSALDAYTSGSVTRIAGADRFATAAAISKQVFSGGASLVYVATGENYPDALSAGATAARAGVPILLVRRDQVPAATAAELARLDPDRIIVMGGESVVGSGVLNQLKSYAGTVTRISGENRYATAINLSRATFADNGVSHVYLATGTSYPDGLSAGPVASRHGAPLLLVDGRTLSPEVAAELRRLNPREIVILGGTNVITNALRDQVRALWP